MRERHAPALTDKRLPGLLLGTNGPWYEEEQQVFVHARDPYMRVDVLPSSRHVRIVLGGVTIANTPRPQLLLESWLPIRYYIPEQDVHMELLELTETTSQPDPFCQDFHARQEVS